MRLKIQLTHKFMYYTNIIYDDDGWKYCRRMKTKTSEKTELKCFKKLFFIITSPVPLADCIFRLCTMFFRFLRSQILWFLAILFYISLIE
jgi:dTDP-4-dehydrorhamnose reductase